MLVASGGVVAAVVVGAVVVVAVVVVVASVVAGAVVDVVAHAAVTVTGTSPARPPACAVLAPTMIASARPMRMIPAARRRAFIASSPALSCLHRATMGTRT